MRAHAKANPAETRKQNEDNVRVCNYANMWVCVGELRGLSSWAYIARNRSRNGSNGVVFKGLLMELMEWFHVRSHNLICSRRIPLKIAATPTHRLADAPGRDNRRPRQHNYPPGTFPHNYSFFLRCKFNMTVGREDGQFTILLTPPTITFTSLLMKPHTHSISTLKTPRKSA